MRKLLVTLVVVLGSFGCGKSIVDQCKEIAVAQCAWAYRCPDATSASINRGTSEADCVAKFGFSGAPGPGCDRVTSDTQACSPPTRFQPSMVDGCVAEMKVAACTADPFGGASCKGTCR